ncbi:hypothetical protein HMPREF9057_01838, partial [Actinomyces sp. oral taxon 171 str. F0337]
MRGLVSQTIPSRPPHSQQEASQRAEEDAGSVREREMRGEQVVVDLAYSELDRQLAQARHSLARTEAQGVSGTHQSRGERDAYAVHYSSLVSSLEGVEDRLVFGRMDMSTSPDDASDSGASGRAPAAVSGSGRGVGGS